MDFLDLEKNNNKILRRHRFFISSHLIQFHVYFSFTRNLFLFTIYILFFRIRREMTSTKEKEREIVYVCRDFIVGYRDAQVEPLSYRYKQYEKAKYPHQERRQYKRRRKVLLFLFFIAHFLVVKMVESRAYSVEPP